MATLPMEEASKVVTSVAMVALLQATTATVAMEELLLGVSPCCLSVVVKSVISGLNTCDVHLHMQSVFWEQALHLLQSSARRSCAAALLGSPSTGVALVVWQLHKTWYWLQFIKTWSWMVFKYLMVG